MNARSLVITTLLVFFFNLYGCAIYPSRLIERNADAALDFEKPDKNSVVKNPVTVKFRLSGIQQPQPDSGKPHVHLLINSDMPALDRVMPHQGEGVREIEAGKDSIKITLPPGFNQLQLIAADQWHRSHFPPLISEIITIKVVE